MKKPNKKIVLAIISTSLIINITGFIQYTDKFNISDRKISHSIINYNYKNVYQENIYENSTLLEVEEIFCYNSNNGATLLNNTHCHLQVRNQNINSVKQSNSFIFPEMSFHLQTGTPEQYTYLENAELTLSGSVDILNSLNNEY